MERIQVEENRGQLWMIKELNRIGSHGSRDEFISFLKIWPVSKDDNYITKSQLKKFDKEFKLRGK